MLNLQNNLKGQFKGGVSCPRCEKLKNLHRKYEIQGFEDVFENINLEKLRKVAWFLREANLKSWVV